MLSPRIYEAFQLKWEGDSDQPTFLTRNVLEKKPPVLMESVQLDGDLVCMRKSGRSSLVWNWKTGARAQIALAPSLRVSKRGFTFEEYQELLE